jgi:hypothetical protein
MKWLKISHLNVKLGFPFLNNALTVDNVPLFEIPKVIVLFIVFDDIAQNMNR